LTPEEAHAAYVAAANRLRTPDPSAAETRAQLMKRLRSLYEEHGIAAMSTTFLEKTEGLYKQLLIARIGQPDYLAELGLTEEYATWRGQHRTYRGVTKPKWTWEEAVNRAREVKERVGVLPTLEWFRHKDNGLVPLPNAVFGNGRTWLACTTRRSTARLATKAVRRYRIASRGFTRMRPPSLRLVDAAIHGVCAQRVRYRARTKHLQPAPRVAARPSHRPFSMTYPPYGDGQPANLIWVSVTEPTRRAKWRVESVSDALARGCAPGDTSEFAQTPQPKRH
jgi:hypothetical protein